MFLVGAERIVQQYKTLKDSDTVYSHILHCLRVVNPKEVKDI